MGFKVYKSSAGSGKTYTLVKEFLKIVLKNPYDYKHTLAITFTNKAASEMKSRILESLQNIAHLEQLGIGEKSKIEFLVDQIAEEISLDKSVIKENAAKSLSLILYNYSDFAVSTIDSFVMSIVRSFAKDLHLPVNFEVELDSSILLNQAVDLLISRVGADELLTTVLVNFIESRADEQKGFNIENDLFEIGTYLFKEDSIAYIEKIKKLTLKDFNEITHQLYAEIKSNENKLKSIAEKACALIESTNVPHAAFYYKERGLPAYFRNMAELKTDGIHNKNVAKGIEQDKWTSQDAGESDITAINSVKIMLQDYYSQIQDFAENELTFLMLYKLMVKNIFPLSVLTEINSIIEEVKIENNLLHISEFNKKISDIVLNEPVPFIYERIGARFKNYMVDEFQDTSVLQWLNLLPLIENALSESGFTMLVGDAKQAIYRWRGGEVEQFVYLPKVFAEHKTDFHIQKEAVLGRYYEEFKLDKNFRSKKEIVEFNNSFFEFAKGFLDANFCSFYNDVMQFSDNENKGGLVNINFLDKENIKESTFNEIIKIINDITVNDNYEPSDIAILCRTNKNANEVARFLMENGVNVVSNESLLLQNSPVINFLIASLEYLEKSENIIAKTVMLNFLTKAGKINVESLHDAFSNLVKQPNSFEGFLRQEFSDFINSELQKLSVYELCESLIRIFKLNDTPNPFIIFFLDVVLNFSSNKQNGIKAFLLWWQNNSSKFSVVVPEGENAVKIMSIHKSKGLQFPVVIYPFAKEPYVKPTKQNVWVDIEDERFENLKTFLLPVSKKLERTPFSDIYNNELNKTHLDVLNILYVVLTRPEERLYVLTEKPGKINSTFNIHNLFMQYLKSVNCWSDDEHVYSFGSATINTKSKKETQIPDIKYDSFISNDWKRKLIMLHQKNKFWDVENPEQNYRRGNIIHSAMASVGSCADKNTAINNLLIEGIISEDESADLENVINWILEHETLKGYFQDGVKYRNESEIIDAEGKIYRPDRIVFKNDTTVVIDYKTGKPLLEHKKQIFNYARLLSECGCKNISTILVYPDTKMVEKETL